MRDEHFRRFLESSYVGSNGRPLSKRAAGDYVSRCRRVETLLGCDLDQIEGFPEDFAIRIERKAGPLATAGIRSLQSAVRAYLVFRRQSAADGIAERRPGCTMAPAKAGDDNAGG